MIRSKKKGLKLETTELTVSGLAVRQKFKVIKTEFDKKLLELKMSRNKA